MVVVGFIAGIRSFIGARDGGAVAAVNRFFFVGCRNIYFY